MDISVVVPVFEEAESLPILHEEIGRALAPLGREYEIIFVDDGSRDDSWAVIRDLAARDAHVRGIRFRRNFGKAAALTAGFRAATSSPSTPTCRTIRRKSPVSWRCWKRGGMW